LTFSRTSQLTLETR